MQQLVLFMLQKNTQGLSRMTLGSKACTLGSALTVQGKYSVTTTEKV